MRRPSSLNVPCAESAALGEKYPTTSDAALNGTTTHVGIHEGKPVTPEARTALEYIAKRNVIGQERKVKLVDPESGEVLTEGTADVLFDDPDEHGDPLLEVGDFKTSRPEFVTPPDENNQLHAYGLAAALEMGRERYTVSLLFLDGERIHVAQSRVVEGADFWAMLDRVRKECQRPSGANPGAHCSGCFQRTVCGVYRERAALALTLLPKAPHDLTLNDETATALVLRARAVREACDLAEELAKAHVQAGGKVEADGKSWGPTQVNGRKSGPSVKELESQGLGHLVKQGQPFTKWEWRRSA